MKISKRKLVQVGQLVAVLTVLARPPFKADARYLPRSEDADVTFMSLQKANEAAAFVDMIKSDGSRELSQRDDSVDGAALEVDLLDQVDNEPDEDTKESEAIETASAAIFIIIAAALACFLLTTAIIFIKTKCS